MQYATNEWIVACDGSLGLHLVAQRNNSPRSQLSQKAVLVVSLLSTVLGKKTVVCNEGVRK